MGLSSFPSAAEGVLPALVTNTLLSVAILKNMMRSVLQVVGANRPPSPDYAQEDPAEGYCPRENARERRISITQFKSLCQNDSGTTSGRANTLVECCVCLRVFEDEEEVSELACKHFFHRGCLDKWFGHFKHITCPLCRSTV